MAQPSAPAPTRCVAFRGRLLHFFRHPDTAAVPAAAAAAPAADPGPGRLPADGPAFEYLEDGVLVVDTAAGTVAAVGPAADLLGPLASGEWLRGHRRCSGAPESLAPPADGGPGRGFPSTPLPEPPAGCSGPLAAAAGASATDAAGMSATVPKPVGPAASASDSPASSVAVPVTWYPDGLLVPGFVDCHVHYPQLEMIASFGKQLIEWLRAYTFPAERKFGDAAHARRVASLFCDELLRHGTTSANVFCTVHPESVDAFFEAAERRSMRVIAGKVLMDDDGVEGLCDASVEASIAQSRELIARWHGRGRLAYAVTPRFAVTSSPGQLAAAGRLLAEHEGVYLHTHLCENRAEMELVRQKHGADYLRVYDRAGLVRPRSLFAHCIWMTDAELARLHERDAAVAWCPGSNHFLGSGHFRYVPALRQRLRCGLGSDVGAGTSLSIGRAQAQAYESEQLRRTADGTVDTEPVLSPLAMVFLATLGGAEALDMHDRVGNFAVGKEADFVVLDLKATPVIAARTANAKSLEELLFALSILGDDRMVAATYVLGRLAHARDAPAKAAAPVGREEVTAVAQEAEATPRHGPV